MQEISAFLPHANRGNVAIIAWNTLQAAMWDVNSTKLDGEVSLGQQNNNTLLNTHFRAYCYNGELKEVKDTKVLSVPSTDKEIGDRQITLDIAGADYDFNAMKAFEDAPKKNEEEATYKTTKTDNNNTYVDTVVAYVPEEIYDDIDDLYGRKITVIFGDDNEVALIIVEDDAVNDKLLTEYDASATVSKFVVGNETYKFADKADKPEVFVNTRPITKYDENNQAVVSADEAMKNIYSELGITASKDVYEDYNKVIKANVVLNGKGRVTRLDLYVSGTYAKFNTVEAIVTKVKKEKITLQYVNGTDIDATFTYDYSDIDEDELPRVLRDGKNVTLDDIAVNDVVTYYYDKDLKKPETIYIASASINGEVTKAKKTDMKLYIDGTAYVPSMGMLLVTDEDPEDVEKAANANDLVGEEVTLYTNIYGEYVMAVTDIVSSDWTFAYLTRVNDIKDDEDDDEKSYFQVRLLMDDDSTTRAYTIYCDDEDDYTDLVTLHTDLVDNETFVAFKTSANNEIKWDEICTIAIDGQVNGENKTKLEKDYKFFKVSANSSVNDDRQRITADNGTSYKYVSNSVIFNINGREAAEVIKKWKSLVKDDKTVTELLLVVENKDSNTTIDYVVADLSSNIGTSDALYAVVDQDEYKVSEKGDTVKYLDLLTEDGVEAIKAYNADRNFNVDEKAFVEYILKSDKLDTVKQLVDVKNFKKLDEDDEIDTEIANGVDTKLAVNEVSGETLTGEIKPTEKTELDAVGFFDAADKPYYMEIVNGIFPTAGNNVTVIQENEALREAYEHMSEFTDAKKEKEYTVAELADGYAVLVKAGCDVKITVKQDNEVYAIYTINAKNLELSKDATETTPETIPVVTGAVKANYKVIDTENLLIKYEDEENDVVFTFGELEIDEDVLIYDLRDGFATMSFDEFEKEVETEKYLYVVAYRNSDCDTDADANVLVIVE